MSPDRPPAGFAALLRTSLLVCALSFALTLLIWVLFRRLKL